MLCGLQLKENLLAFGTVQVEAGSKTCLELLLEFTINFTFGMSAKCCCSAAFSGPSPTNARRVVLGRLAMMVFSAFKFFSAMTAAEYIQGSVNSKAETN